MLQRNPGSLRNFRRIGSMRQSNARTAAIQTDALEHRRKGSAMPRIPVLDTKNLQTIYFNLFVVEHAYASRRNSMEIFAVVPKLLMISSDEIHTVWRS